MFDTIFKNIWFIGWLIYLLGIYSPRMRRYRKSVIVLDRSRGVDIAHDMLVFLAGNTWVFVTAQRFEKTVRRLSSFSLHF